MKRPQAGTPEKRIEDLKAENLELRGEVRAMKTGLKDLGARLQRREEIYQAIPSIIVVIQNGRIMEVNRNAVEQLGWVLEDLLGRSFLDIVDPESRAMVRQIHARRLARKSVPEEYEADLVTKSGVAFPCEVRVRKILLGGKRAFVVSVTPMDRRKEREENRVQAKKLEAVQTMASALAARFEECGFAVREQVQRLRGEAPMDPDVTSGVIRALDAISSDALQTTGSLRMIARKEDAPPEGTPFDFRSVVKEAIALGRAEWESRIGSDPGCLQVKTYLRSGPCIRGSADEFRDVIVHLIRNALESMPRGGDLYVTSEESDGVAHLYIMDNGAGVTDRIRDRIFDPFFTTREDGAAGLGLSMAYAVIQRHGGEIEISSGKGQGTEIHVSIPVASEERSEETPPTRTAPRPPRILVIANTPSLRELLVRVFSFRGWEVIPAVSPAHGLDLLKKEAWAGVLLESVETGLGWSVSVCRRIKALDSSLPVILMAADGKEGEPAAPTEDVHAFDLLVHKPLNMDRFQDQVQRLLFQAGAVRA